MIRFWPKFGAIVVLCVLCFAAACLAEGEDAYVGGWELASYRAYKTVLDESPSMGLELFEDGSGRMRLTGGRELPLSWQLSEHGLRISPDAAAAEELIDGRIRIEVRDQRVIVEIRQDSVTIAEVYIFKRTADGAGRLIQTEDLDSEFIGCWRSSSDGRTVNEDVALCIGSNGEGLLVEWNPVVGRKVDVLQWRPLEDGGICILDSFGDRHEASIEQGVLSCDFTSACMLKTDLYDGASHFSYSLNGDGESVTLRAYMFADRHVQIPETIHGKPVTALSGGLFAGNDALQEVVVPEGIQALPERIFSGCGRLSSVQLPESLREIGRYAFEGCTALNQLCIPEGVEWIADGNDGSFRRNEAMVLVVPHGSYAEQYALENGLKCRISAMNRSEDGWEAWSFSGARNADGEVCSPAECGVSGEMYVLLDGQGSGLLYADGCGWWFAQAAEEAASGVAACNFLRTDADTLEFVHHRGTLIFSRADDSIAVQLLSAVDDSWDPTDCSAANVLCAIVPPIHYESEAYYALWSGTWIAELASGSQVYLCRLEMDGRLDCRRIEALYLPESVELSWQMRWRPTGEGILIWTGDDPSAARTALLRNGQIEMDQFGEAGLRFSRCDAYGNLLASLGADANRQFAALLGAWTGGCVQSDDARLMAQLTLNPDGTAHWQRVGWPATGLKGAQVQDCAGEWTRAGSDICLASEEGRLIFSLEEDALRVQTEDGALTLRHTADLSSWTGSGYRGRMLAEYARSGFIGVWESGALSQYDMRCASVCLASDGSARIEVRRQDGDAWEVDAYPASWWPAESGVGLTVLRSIPELFLAAGEDCSLTARDGGLEWSIPGYGPTILQAVQDERADALRTELICGFDPADEAWEAAANAEGFVPGQSYGIGDTVYIGRFDQDGNGINGSEPIEWRILDVQDGRVLLLSERILWKDYFNDKDGDYTAWEACALNEVLNADFLRSVFTTEEAAGIQTTLLPKTTNAGGPDATECRIFLLSAEEVEEYLVVRQERCAQMSVTAYQRSSYFDGTEGYSTWWLRSSSYVSNNDWVDWNGQLRYGKPEDRRGVRPAMWYALPEGVNASGPADQAIALSSSPEDYFAGNTIYFGSYEQDGDLWNGAEPIAWQILSTDRSSALLISERVLDMHVYHDDTMSRSVPWHRTDLCIWLNDRFLNAAFTQEDRERLLGFNPNQWNGTSSLRVTLLSAAQVERYFPDPASRIARPSAFVLRQYADLSSTGTSWWLRIDADQYDDVEERIVSGRNGGYQHTMLDYNRGVRPVIRISVPDGVAPSSLASSAQMPTVAEAQEAKHQEQEQLRNQATAPDSFRWEACGDGVAILQYGGSDERVVVPAEIEGRPVTAIGEQAFAELGFLKEVVLPDGVVSIGAKAFYKCEGLELVRLPASIADIGKFAFNNCPKLSLLVAEDSFAQAYAASKKLTFTTETAAIE